MPKPDHKQPIRGYLSASPMKHGGERWFHWTASVYQGDVLLWSDDCRDRDKLIPEFEETLKAFLRLEELGQRFDSWSDIVDRVKGI